MTEQETKDGLPVTEVSREEFQQMVDQGETVPADPLAVDIPPDAIVRRLEAIIGNLTTQATIGQGSLGVQALSMQARRALADKDSELAKAEAARQAAEKRLQELRRMLAGFVARMEQCPDWTARQLIDGGSGWAPIPLDQYLSDEEAD